MKLNNKGYVITVIVFGMLIVFIIILSSLLITMNNNSKLNKPVKKVVIENVQLSADPTGMSLTERIEQLEYQMSNIKQETINEIYPVGSIYISTTDDSVAAVVARFGGEWEPYSQGRKLVGVGTGTDINGNVSTFSIDNTGGEYSHTLTISNLPSHNHSYTPAGKITSTFKGDTKNTGTESQSHTHTATYAKSNATTGSTVLSEKHLPHRSLFSLINGTGASVYTSGVAWGHIDIAASSWAITTNYDANQVGILSSPGGVGHTHSIPTTSTSVTSGKASATHTHSITPSGTVTSSFAGTPSNTGNVGSGTSFNVQDPYITVYMYKRIK